MFSILLLTNYNQFLSHIILSAVMLSARTTRSLICRRFVKRKTYYVRHVDQDPWLYVNFTCGFISPDLAGDVEQDGTEHNLQSDHGYTLLVILTLYILK